MFCRSGASVKCLSMDRAPYMRRTFFTLNPQKYKENLIMKYEMNLPTKTFQTSQIHRED